MTVPKRSIKGTLRTGPMNVTVCERGEGGKVREGGGGGRSKDVVGGRDVGIKGEGVGDPHLCGRPTGNVCCHETTTLLRNTQ